MASFIRWRRISTSPDPVNVRVFKTAFCRPRLADRVLPKAMIDYSNGYDLKNEDGAVKHTA